MPDRNSSPDLFGEIRSRPAPAPPKPNDQANWITAHCDGGARGNPGPSGYGVEVTGPDGQVIAELSEFLGNRTNNYAEYSGLLASLQYALDHNYPRLKVISDSELMVKQIQGKYKVNSPDLRPLWQEAKDRIAQLDAFEIAHALRHKNKAADALANQAMDRGMKRTPAPTSPTSTSPSLKGPGAPSLAATSPMVGSNSINQPSAVAPKATMLRGFTRDGTVHILGGATLPDGIFVKIIPE